MLGQSWGVAAERALGRDPFAAPFSALWAGDVRHRQPSILISSTHVESGTRIIAAGNMQFLGRPFYEAWDRQFDPLVPLTLGAAVLDSARFPFVSNRTPRLILARDVVTLRRHYVVELNNA